MAARLCINILCVFCFMFWYIRETSADWLDETSELNYTNSDNGCIRLEIPEGAVQNQTNWLVRTDLPKAHGISIQLNWLNSSHQFDEFLMLAPGNITAATGFMYMFTGLIDSNSTKNIVLPYHDTLYVRYEGYSPGSGFEICYKLYRLNITGPPPPIPDLKPPMDVDAYTYIVVAGGEFSDPKFIQQFTMAMYNISLEYCEENHILCDATKPANESIIIDDWLPCPKEWPDSDNCTQVNIAAYMSPRPGLKYLLRSTVEDDYELTGQHIQDMWRKYGHDYTVRQYGFERYTKRRSALLWWTIWIPIVIVLLIILSLIMWILESKLDDSHNTLNDNHHIDDEHVHKEYLTPSKFQRYPDSMFLDDDRSTLHDGNFQLRRQNQHSHTSSLKYRDRASLELPPTPDETHKTEFGGGLRFAPYDNDAFED